MQSKPLFSLYSDLIGLEQSLDLLIYQTMGRCLSSENDRTFLDSTVEASMVKETSFISPNRATTSLCTTIF